jgi:hypothetical protein
VGKWREAMNKVGGISGFVFDTRWCISSTPFSLAFCCSWGWENTYKGQWCKHKITLEITKILKVLRWSTN